MDHPDREFTEFIDRVAGRVKDRPGVAFLRRNRHVESPAVTWRKRYDAETEKYRAYLVSVGQMRKAS